MTNTGGTSVVWKTWVATSDTTTASYSSSGNVWNIWCDSGTASTTATASTANVWYRWNEQYVEVSGNRISYQYKPAHETEEQKQIRLQQAEERRLAEEIRKKAEAEAKEKAERLLISMLNPVQLQQLKEMDAFIIQLETRRYRIRRNQRVQELGERDEPIAEYCIIPSPEGHGIPNADVMLAKKLMLEHDEASFLRIANRTSMVQ